MKRMILATTAALALAAPAFAQSQIETTVGNALVQYGYDASVVQTLSDAQVTELYLAITSEDVGDVRAIIDAIGVDDSAMGTGAADNDQLTSIVDAELVAAGFPAGTASMLTDAEVTELYLAATGESGNDVDVVINGLTFGMGNMENDVINSSAERYVVASLMSRGVEMDTVLDLTDAELAELYIALTSGSESEVRNTLQSIQAS